ncbi:polysaccharide pyruvyl transferase family protein [Halopseudomonas xiamenensis]|uniref:polysaccharide pyruvyl transferase family protein n=1 Tax=Halopseudomonas xiamenensis TaxID=157792 RepID=UPI00162A8FFA|nr:polysaccharide pyruvyl transferase family protein [Halopseudomonas xiamenensis]
MKKHLKAILGYPPLLFLCDRLLFSIQRKSPRGGAPTLNANPTPDPVGAAPRRDDRTHQSPRGGAPTYSLLIAPPGGGNIGDQAMVECFLENTPGQIIIICRTPSDISIPAEYHQRTQLVALPGLIYGHLPNHLASMQHFLRLLHRAESVAITGADIMDGAYNWHASSNRANLAWLAAQTGVPVRILGFSWNGHAHPHALRALKRASAAGAQLCLRDPLSAERARADGLANVSEVADMVFAARTVDLDAASRLLASLPAGSRYALVNASGLIGSGQQIEEYRPVIRELQHHGLHVVLLPHVSRPGGDDLRLCRQIHQAVDDPALLLIDHLPCPATIRGLTAGATLVVTGRMHLAIMSLYHAVPAITLATQGKVEGLMRLFGAECLCVDPQPGFGQSVIAIIRQVLSQPEDLHQHLLSKLPEVRAMARRNFIATARAATEREATAYAYD